MHGLGAQEEAPAAAGRARARAAARRPRADSEAGWSAAPCVEPPSGSSPNAIATASTSVDLPEPFSPTRKVTPGAASGPRPPAGPRPAPSSATRRRAAAAGPGRRTRARTGGWSKSMSGPYDRAPPRLAAMPAKSPVRRDRGRRPGGAGQQPRPGLLPGVGRHQARPRRVLPRGRPRHRQRALRAALHAAPLPQGAGRRQGAPEAGAAGRAALAGDRAAAPSRAGTAPPTSSASPSWPA